MEEKKFAEVLGISYTSYMNIKNKGKRAKILEENKQELRRIKYQLRGSREYTKLELEQICNKYDVTIQELLKSIYIRDDIVDKYMQRDIIYIGKCAIPRKFSNQYAKNLLDIAKEVSKILTKKYKLSSCSDDFASDSLIYILKNRGDIVKNGDDDTEILLGLKRCINSFIKYSCLNKLHVKKTISLDDDMNGEYSSKRFSNARSLHEVVKDRDEDIEQEIEIKEANKEMEQIDENEIVLKMRECYEEGMNNVQAIKAITKEYGISKEELLRILEEELERKRKIVKTIANKVYLGEELE